MANYAILDEQNKVSNVIVYDLSDPDPSWILVEEKHGLTSTTGSFYSHELKNFSGSKPFQSWIYNSQTNTWNSPVEKPTDHDYYLWDEVSQKWIDMKPPMLEITDDIINIDYEIGDRRVVGVGSTATYEVWNGTSWLDVGLHWALLSL